MDKKQVLNDLEELDNLKIDYLDTDSYNQKQGGNYYEELPITKKLKTIYSNLWTNLIINFINNNSLDIDNTDLSINFIGRDENGFYIQWYEPETITYIKDMLNNKAYTVFNDYKK